MKFFKYLISTFIILGLLLSLTAGVFAAEEKTYDVTYKSMTLYESDCIYAWKVTELENKRVYTSVNKDNFDVAVNFNELAVDIKIIRKSDGKEVANKNKELAAEIGQESVNIFWNNGKKKIKFVFNKEYVPEPKWTSIKTTGWDIWLKYGSNSNRDYITLGKTDEYTTALDIYGEGQAVKKIFNYAITLKDFKKLNIDGDTVLTDNNIPKELTKDECANRCKWYKVDFVMNVKEQVEEITPTIESTEPVSTPTPTPTTTTIPGTTADTFPDTGGEGNSIPFIIVGLIILVAGVVIFMKRDKIVRN